jgi:Ca2+:H+ antiporter
LIVGGLKHREQTFNLYGANSFLAVIMPIAILGLVMPNFTTASAAGTSSPLQAGFLILMSVGMYAVFLAMQTSWHREYFIAPSMSVVPAGETGTPQEEAEYHGLHEVRSIPYHTGFLLAYLLPVVILAKQIAIPINHGIDTLGAPPALGGLLVAILILSPESLAAVRAARANHLQRSINLALGSVLASISLTIPAVLIIGFITGKTVVLGLGNIDMILLSLSLVVSVVTFGLERMNVMLGAVHMMMFLAYLMLIFD